MIQELKVKILKVLEDPHIIELIQWKCKKLMNNIFNNNKTKN
jgi:hypothetical protein